MNIFLNILETRHPERSEGSSVMRASGHAAGFFATLRMTVAMGLSGEGKL
jgi:hypothetical protein